MLENDNTLSHSAAAKRVRYLPHASWGAVFAGLALALTVSLLLHLLGTAIGMATIDPEQEANPVAGLATGAGIWMLLSGIISVAIGGYVAGRLAPRHGMLHGLLVWAVSTLVTVYLIASLLGSALSGTLSVAGSGLQAVGSGVASMVPAVGGQIREQLEQADIELDLDDMQNELKAILRDTGKPELAPQNIAEDAEQIQQQAQVRAERAREQPQAADEQVASLFERIREKAGETLDAADREALVNLLRERGNMTQQEAEQMATQIEQQYQQAYARFQELRAQAEQKAREVADEAARRASQASWVLLITLLITGVVAGLAGMFGYRGQPKRANSL